MAIEVQQGKYLYLIYFSRSDHNRIIVNLEIINLQILFTRKDMNLVGHISIIKLNLPAPDKGFTMQVEIR